MEHGQVLLHHESHANKKNFYLGVIIFLVLAWLATMVVCYLTHKPCTCRGVVVEHAQPTHVTTKVPFVGTFHVPVLTSPDASGNLESVLDFLKRKGTSLSGQPFNSDIHKALNLAWLWQWNTNSTPPVGIFNRGVTQSTYYLVYDQAQKQWTITTTSPYG